MKLLVVKLTTWMKGLVVDMRTWNRGLVDFNLLMAPTVGSTETAVTKEEAGVQCIEYLDIHACHKVIGLFAPGDPYYYWWGDPGVGVL